MMEPTICPRCGGHKYRCECADLRREGMEMAAAFLTDTFRWGNNEGTYEVLERAREELEALARKPTL